LINPRFLPAFRGASVAANNGKERIPGLEIHLATDLLVQKSSNTDVLDSSASIGSLSSLF